VTASHVETLAAPSDMSPAADVARDLAKRGAMILPVVVGVVALVSNIETAVSVGYAMAIILVNFLLSAYLLVWAARISLGLVASVALGGYVMRLALVFMAVWLVKDTAWVRMIPLGITIIVTHLGLLTWELRYVSATFAHPGLKPEVGGGQGRRSQPAAGYRSDRFRTEKTNPQYSNSDAV
jgi:hypothetical protein